MLYKRFATGSIELKADKATRSVEGYASVFNVLDHDFDIVTPGAFARTLEKRVDRVKLLWQHNPGQPIGKPSLMQEDGFGLRVAAKVSETPLGDEALTLAADGVVDSFSIGYNVVRKEMIERSAPMGSVLEALGGSESSLASDLSKLSELMAKIATAPYSVRLLKEVELFEFSLVTFPANESAVVTGVKSMRSKWRSIQAAIGSQESKELREFLEVIGAPVYLLDVEDEDDARFVKSGGAPDESKAGRVLSKANLERLSAAHAAIGLVIEAATPKGDVDEDDEDEDDTKAREGELDVKSVLGAIRDSFNPSNFAGSAVE